MLKIDRALAHRPLPLIPFPDRPPHCRGQGGGRRSYATLGACAVASLKAAPSRSTRPRTGEVVAPDWLDMSSPRPHIHAWVTRSYSSANFLMGGKSMVRAFMITGTLVVSIALSATAFAQQQGQFGNADDAKAMLAKSIAERARAFVWDRSADHIRASGQTGALKGRIHGCTRKLRCYV